MQKERTHSRRRLPINVRFTIDLLLAALGGTQGTFLDFLRPRWVFVFVLFLGVWVVYCFTVLLLGLEVLGLGVLGLEFCSN